ncbi:MAG TPA: ATP-binding protein [Opitutaceae bacterium]|nr:ATP-binding protein [Opitutaceae bacterium]
MIFPAIPANDDARLDVLRSLGILDTAPESDYDDLTALAAAICEVPMASITLVDEDRQWFKSSVGLKDRETSRDVSFCAHAVADPKHEILIVPDAHDDPRFADNPLVLGDPRIRFYAGAPLVTQDGWALGTLCVLDREPRELTSFQLGALNTLRKHVINALELRRLVNTQRQVIADLDQARRQIEAARLAAEEAARAKAQFLAAMSHEIRTPMNAVVGMSTLLRDTPLTGEQRDCVDTIHTSSELLLTVINDILDFSKIEAGKLDFESEPFDLVACVKGAVDLLAAPAATKKIPLRIDLAPGLPAGVKGDVTRVRQILINLLSNAVKFTDSGEIVVRVAGAGRPDGRVEVHFSVSDTGVGISAEGLGRLFRNFSQADVSTARRYGGTGLGLAISKRLAELQGGRMWVESEAGRGSRFNFTIVAEKAAPPATKAASAGAGTFDSGFAARHPARILIVEDNPVNQKVLARMLQKLGYAPEIANNGRAGLAAAREAAAPFDLVLMDIEMPEMDGPATSRALRAELPPARQPVIVAVTAHALAEEQNLCLAAGMDGCLTKPIQVPELTATLAGLGELRRHRA